LDPCAIYRLNRLRFFLNLPPMKLLAAWLFLLLTTGLVRAVEDPAHEELRGLRSEIIAAVTKGDIDSVLKHVHPQVVVTWQDSEVCRSAQGLKEFFDRMGKKSFKGYKVPPTPDALTLLYGGDTGISYGETVAEYQLLGKTYEIKSRWTATLVKVDGKWLLAGYHISMNALDNPLLNAAKNALYVAAAVALLAGFLIGKIRRKRRAA
jgi:ketosteroid isomerase-like protein